MNPLHRGNRRGGLLVAWAAVMSLTHAALAAGLPDANFIFTSRDTVLIVSPHPDDESLCCAGVMRRALAANARVAVVWITGGDAFELDARLVEKRLRPGAVGLRKLGEIRAGEASRAADALGIPAANRFMLGYPDRGVARLMLDHYFTVYRSRYTGESNVFLSNAVSPQAPYEGRALTRDLQGVVERLTPTYVFVASPLDAHPDHRASGELAVRLMAERAQLDRVYYWIIHGGFDWPRPRGLHRQEEMTPPVHARTLPWMRFELTSAEQDAKLAALQAHHSQWEIMKPFLEAFVRRNEMFTRVALEPDAPVPLLTEETALPATPPQTP